MKSLRFFAFLLTAIATSAGTALALAANGWTTPVQYSGACPASITLEGMISRGLPNRTVQYSFSYVDPATNTTVRLPQKTTTLDGSGAAQVSAPISIGGGNSGVRLTAIQGAASATSTVTAFSVMCTSVAPTAAPNSGTRSWFAGGVYHRANLAANLAKVASPSGLTYTNDPAECARRLASGNGGLISGLLCGPIISSGQQLMLVWNWSPCTDDPNCAQQIDGYNVYVPRGTGSTTGGRMLYDTARRYGPLQPISTVNRQDTPETFVKTFHAGECFVVTAFKGSIESPFSPQFCLPQELALGVKPTAVTLPVSRSRSISYRYSNQTGFLPKNFGDSNRRVNNSEGIAAGYSYNTYKSVAGDVAFNEIMRGAFLFNLNGLAGKQIKSAVLHLHANNTTIGQPPQPAANISCASALGTEVEPWWNEYGWLDGDFAWPLSTGRPNIDVDVTQQVRYWTTGAETNYGFVLRGPDENLNAFTEKSCTSSYDASLDVVTQ